jgi:hypothetical protein
MYTRIAIYLLLGTVALGISVKLRADAPRTRTHIVCVLYPPETINDPAQNASHASLIVEARADKKENPASVKGYKNPLWSEGLSRNLAWEDVRFDRIKVLWKDEAVGEIGPTLHLRRYDAETPEVSLRNPYEPTFRLGERYILFLTENDTLAYDQGLPHWRPVSGAFGVFQLKDGKVSHKTRTFTMPELEAAIQRGVADPRGAEIRRHRWGGTNGVHPHIPPRSPRPQRLPTPPE